VRVIRPADANEVAEAWRQAVLHIHGPTVIILSRQNLPVLDRSVLAPASGLARGAYILRDVEAPDVVLIGTGSEVALVLEAADKLVHQDIHARVVSMPCWELFDAQNEDYRKSVFPDSVPARIAVETGTPMGWHKYVGDKGSVIGLERFGASAPDHVVLNELGFTVENVVAHVRRLLGRG
jgi:transketolase